MDDLDSYLRMHGDLSDVVVQGVDLRGYGHKLRTVACSGTAFLGVEMDNKTLQHLLRSGAVVFPPLKDLPFNPYRSKLYSQSELTAAVDDAIYRWIALHPRGSHLPVMSALARRLHDHAITDALQRHLADTEVVAVTGGHVLERREPGYRDVVALGRELTRVGWLVTTGGGPGAMEAANLGAWLASYSDDDVDDAMTVIAAASAYKNRAAYLAAGQAVLDTFTDGCDSLALPTWFYGHEPTNQFATHIAKYFNNSVREDGLLAVAHRGVIFTPGSAGTVSEIFLDAVQNHYNVFGVISPMVFFGSKFFTEILPSVPLLKKLAGDNKYGEMVGVVDRVEDVLDFLHTHPPVHTHPPTS